MRLQARLAAHLPVTEGALVQLLGPVPLLLGPLLLWLVASHVGLELESMQEDHVTLAALEYLHLRVALHRMVTQLLIHIAIEAALRAVLSRISLASFLVVFQLLLIVVDLAAELAAVLCGVLAVAPLHVNLQVTLTYKGHIADGADDRVTVGLLNVGRELFFCGVASATLGTLVGQLAGVNLQVHLEDRLELELTLAVWALKPSFTCVCSHVLFKARLVFVDLAALSAGIVLDGVP